MIIKKVVVIENIANYIETSNILTPYPQKTAYVLYDNALDNGGKRKKKEKKEVEKESDERVALPVLPPGKQDTKSHFLYTDLFT